MSLLIKSMEMPTDYPLWVVVSADGTVQYNYFNEWKTAEEKAVPVPPHGRLIDADTMITSIKRQTDFLKIMGDDLATIAEVLEKGFLQEIENAPTIIEAEDGE